jgi:transcriptional regulator with XRE-family HTH domain
MDWIAKITMIERESGRSIADIARCLEVNSRYIYELKNGKNKNPSASFVQALFLNLGINPKWLFTDEGNIFADATEAVLSKSPDKSDGLNQNKNDMKQSRSNRLLVISSEIKTIADDIASTDILPERISSILDNLNLLDEENFKHIDIEIKACLRQQEREASREKESQKREA